MQDDLYTQQNDAIQPQKMQNKPSNATFIVSLVLFVIVVVLAIFAWLLFIPLIKVDSNSPADAIAAALILFPMTIIMYGSSAVVSIPMFILSGISVKKYKGYDQSKGKRIASIIFIFVAAAYLVVSIVTFLAWSASLNTGA